MSEDALVETRIDSDIRDRAEKVLQAAGMTIPDLVRLALTRTAEDGEVPYGLSTGDDPEYDAWFRAQVQEALDDPGPYLTAEEAEAEMAAFKAELLKTLPKTGT
jgi:DNA-damage-inducible protein J